MSRFPVYKQLDSMDCGPACLRMIAKYYGRSYSLQSLRDKCQINRQGVSMLGISEAAEAIGFRTTGARVSFEKFKNDVPLPAIVHWKGRHFIIVYRITKSKVRVADPAYGLLSYSHNEFLAGFIGSRADEHEGIVLMLEPSPDFYQNEGEKINKKNIKFLLSYLKPYKK